jgi:hypothetical protein
MTESFLRTYIFLFVILCKFLKRFTKNVNTIQYLIKKRQFDKDSYLYEVLVHYTKIINTIIGINKHKSKVVDSFKKFGLRIRKKTSAK